MIYNALLKELKYFMIKTIWKKIQIPQIKKIETKINKTQHYFFVM